MPWVLRKGINMELNPEIRLTIQFDDNIKQKLHEMPPKERLELENILNAHCEPASKKNPLLTGPMFRSFWLVATEKHRILCRFNRRNNAICILHIEPYEWPI